MDRRTLLKSIALLGATAAFSSFRGMELMAQTLDPADGGKASADGPADLVAVLGGQPVEMFQRAMQEMGGMEKYVAKGNKVAIKPNMGWDKNPEQGANTNPLLMAEITRQCFAAGASEVFVFDHPCDEWTRAYKSSGIEEAAKAAGATVLPANQEVYFRSVSLPAGRVLKEAKVHRAILDSDLWFNVPVLKHHGGANLTIGMQNYMGLVWDRKFFHRNGLPECIADICTFEKRPALNIIDAYRVITQNGPKGRSENDVVTAKALFIAKDIVAGDTVAARFFNQMRAMPLDHMPYLSYGQNQKIGTMDIDSLNIRRIKM